MKLFVAFLVLCFLAGMTVRDGHGSPRLSWSASDHLLRWFVAGLAVALMVGYYVFNRI